VTATVAIVAAWMLGAYLAGSIPFGWLIGKARGKDIREHGSKNIGATNCGRVCGWPFGVAAFLLDVAKGFGPTAAAVAYLPEQIQFSDEHGLWLAVVLVAAQAIVGHLFPVWLKFKGGKAVATSLGVLPAVGCACGVRRVDHRDRRDGIRLGRLDGRRNRVCRHLPLG